jgi:alcohol dehydrogenase class IV
LTNSWPSSRKIEMPRIERVIAGRGALRALAAELAERGLGRALLISGSSVASLPEVIALREALGHRLAGTYFAVRAHNPTSALDDLLSVARACAADVLIAVGGGSPIDAAKLTSLAAAQGLSSAKRLTDYAVTSGSPALAGPTVPVMAAPTTLSAAEWCGTAAFTVEEEQTKYICRYLELTPTTVVLDPMLASHTPRDLWISTGVRAIDHAVETVYAKDTHPQATASALEALTMLAAGLPATALDPHDHGATLACQRAAGMSLMYTHSVSLGLSHAIGHQLGAFGVPHGVTSCLMLPHVMRFFEPHSRETQQQIADAFARAQRDSREDLSAADRLEMLLTQLGVPRRIRDCGVGKDQLDDVAAAAMREAKAALHAAPRMVTASDVRALLDQAY